MRTSNGQPGFAVVIGLLALCCAVCGCCTPPASQQFRVVLAGLTPRPPPQALDKLTKEWDAAEVGVIAYRDSGTFVIKVGLGAYAGWKLEAAAWAGPAHTSST